MLNMTTHPVEFDMYYSVNASLYSAQAKPIAGRGARPSGATHQIGAYRCVHHSFTTCSGMQ